MCVYIYYEPWQVYMNQYISVKWRLRFRCPFSVSSDSQRVFLLPFCLFVPIVLIYMMNIKWMNVNQRNRVDFLLATIIDYIIFNLLALIRKFEERNSSCVYCVWDCCILWHFVFMILVYLWSIVNLLLIVFLSCCNSRPRQIILMLLCYYRRTF